MDNQVQKQDIISFAELGLLHVTLYDKLTVALENKITKNALSCNLT